MNEPYAMGTELVQVVKAIDALNSWVRSESFKEQESSLRHWIYHLKRCTIRKINAINPNLLRHSRVCSIADCKRCSGGKYYDWDGRLRGPCHKCRGRGRLVLFFVNTLVYEDEGHCGWHAMANWHTPHYDWIISPMSAMANDWPYEPVDWSPNTAGNDLSLAGAARHLLTAEAMFPGERHFRRGGGIYDSWECEDSQYALHLGDMPRHTCTYCGQPASDRPGVGQVRGIGTHCVRGRVSFTTYCCDICSKSLGRAVFDAPIPRDLLVAESVREWMDKHPAKKELVP